MFVVCGGTTNPGAIFILKIGPAGVCTIKIAGQKSSGNSKLFIPLSYNPVIKGVWGGISA